MKKKRTQPQKSIKLSDAVEVINLPPLDPKRTYRIYSPRLKDPERLKDFHKEVSLVSMDDVSQGEAA
ncbi:hypothetical protein HUU05_03030 [candidate division KSB1 bacterium]|nr:hypothetical protein [candidate division KSB1 bacterium]